MRFGRHAAVLVLVATTLNVALPWPSVPVQGAASLTITPITWNIVGLDSNKPTTGPKDFPVAVRVCNTGATAATNINTTFTWDSTNTYINLLGPSVLTDTALAVGNCADYYFRIEV